MKREHLLDQVVGLAKLTGWRVMHQRPARTAQGWRTTIVGDKGFPDVVLAKNSCTVFLELKGPGAYPSIDQLHWLRALGPRAAVVRPEDWAHIEYRLKNPRFEDAAPRPTLAFNGWWVGTLADWAERKVPA